MRLNNAQIFNQPLSSSSGGRPIQIPESSVDLANSYRIHITDGFDRSSERTLIERVYLWWTNRHASLDATAYVAVGGDDAGMWIARNVPAQQTVPLFSNGDPLPLMDTIELRAFVAEGPLPKNLSIVGYVERLNWS